MSEARFNPRALTATCLVVLALFGLAYVAPLHFWGINFHTYLPVYVPIVAVGLAFLLAQGLVAVDGRLLKLERVPTWVWSGAVAVGMWLLFYNCVIQTEMYGDSRVLLKALSPGGVSHEKYWIWGALSPNVLGSKNGEMFTYSLVNGIQAVLGCSVWGAFRVLTAALGFVYAFVWMEFIQRKVKTRLWRVVAASIGLCAGFTQVFYGHPEVYAAPLLVYTTYLIALVHCLEVRKVGWLVALAALLLLSVRTHSAGFALLPTYGYALLVHWAGDNPRRQAWLSWKRAGGMITGASIAVGVMGYFTVFEAGAETIVRDSSGKNIFLSVVSDRTSDNVYAMLSPWHIWDFAQETLLAAAAAFTVVLAILVGLLRKGKWTSPTEVATTMAMILFTTLFFAIDPALTMPRDWDLCALFAPPLLVMAVIYLERHAPALQRAWLPASLLLAIGALQTTAVIVNHSNRTVHLRLIDLAQHTFISGHGGGGFFLRHSLDVPTIAPLERLTILDETIEALKPHETKYNRSEYAFILQIAGVLNFDAGRYDQALTYFYGAVDREPNQFMLYEDLASVEYKLGKFEPALKHAVFAMGHGSRRSANWMVAFLAAVELQQYPLALQIGDDYLQRFGDPEGIWSEIEQVRAMGAAPAVPKDSGQ